MTQVLVVASSSVVRAGLEAIVASSPLLQVAGSTSASSLRVWLEAHEPDVVLAALEAGADGSGTALDTLTDHLDAPALVVLADDPQGIETVEALRRGVRAILPREARPEEIIAAVGAAAAGLVVLHGEATDHLLPHLTGIRRSVPGLRGESLTPREIEVLGMLAEGTGNKGIARRLNISEHTVKFHVGSILAKLNASSRTEAVTLGVRGGLILL